jgi:hypothetical protein
MEAAAPGTNPGKKGRGQKLNRKVKRPKDEWTLKWKRLRK